MTLIFNWGDSSLSPVDGGRGGSGVEYLDVLDSVAVGLVSESLLELSSSEVRELVDAEVVSLVVGVHVVGHDLVIVV